MILIHVAVILLMIFNDILMLEFSFNDILIFNDISFNDILMLELILIHVAVSF